MKSRANGGLAKREGVKLEAITKFAKLPKNLKKAGLAFPNSFKAVVLLNKEGSPKYFVFDTYSLWDLLCAADEKYEKSASPKEYVFHNPLGWLIDAIESHLPLNPKVIARLKKAIRQARQTGFVPLRDVLENLKAA